MIMEFWFNQWFGKWGWLIALAIAIIVVVPIFVWVRIKKHLTLWACILAGFLAIGYWMINPLFFILLLTFFVSSNILTAYRKKDKKDVQDKFDKGGERDTSQVLANGLAGFIFAIGHLLIFVLGHNTATNIIISNAFVFALVTAIATTNADTWGTEIGILSQDQPYWILNLRKKVERGTSGGISPKGTGAAFIGSLIVASIGLLIAILWKNPIPASSTWQIYVFFSVAAIAGLIGAMIDSLLGATIQGFFKCTVCGKGTEKRIHCNEHTTLQRGKEWFLI